MKPFILTGLILLTCFISFGQSQQLTKVTKPSPDVQAMQKYGDIPVSPYTGVPNISIPLYTVSFRDISFPISLSYHASGIKVDEEASRVGLGWSLNAGGAISRNVIGEDDWNGNTYFNAFNNDLPDFSDGKAPTVNYQTDCDFQYFNWPSTNISNLNLSDYINASPVYDFQPDYYYYNLPGGHSGKFIMKRTKEAVLQSQELIQIKPTATNGSTWEMIDENGYIYDFNTFETCNTYDGNPPVRSAWYLTKITSPHGNSVSFNYQPTSSYVTPVGAWRETRDDHVMPYALNTSYGSFPNELYGNQSGWANGKDYSTMILSSIDFTNGIVKFDYSSSRQDVKNDYRLDDIAVYLKSPNGIVSTTPLKIFNLTYDYFTGGTDPAFASGTTATGFNALRLKLTQVQEAGSVNGQTIQMLPYKFNYNETGIQYTLPAKTSFARDHWGYYNGKSGHVSLIPTFTPINSLDEKTHYLGIQGNERDADPAYMQAFTLHSIVYPTGGSTEFQYESNTFDEQLSQVNDHSMWGDVYTILSETKSITYDYAAGKHWEGEINTVDMTDKYESAPQVQLNVTYLFSNSTDQFYPELNDLVFTIYDESDNVVGHPEDIQLMQPCTTSQTNNCLSGNSYAYTYYSLITTMPAGKYHVVVSVNDQRYSSILQKIMFRFTYNTQVNSNNPNGTTFSYGGGLRIKEIINHDAVSANGDKTTKYLYHYQKDQNNDGTPEEYSYGIRMSKPEYTYFATQIETVTNDFGEPLISQYAFHMMRSADSYIPLNGSASGAIVGYSTVIEMNGGNGENGQTIYTFHNKPDIVNPYDFNNFNLQPPYSSTISDDLNGSIIKQTVYKKNSGTFQKIKETANTYTTSFGEPVYSIDRTENIVYGLQSVRVPSHTRIARRDGSVDDLGTSMVDPCGFLEMSYQSLQSEWHYLSSSHIMLYDPLNATQYTETVTNYTYDRTTLLPSITQTINSKGQQVSLNIKYPLDYTTGTATDAFTSGIKNLQNKHIINAPIETYTQISNSDGTNKRTVSSVLTSYNSTTTTPSLIYQTQLASPMMSFVPASINTSGLVKDGNYTSNPIISFDNYDANGNLLQQHKTNDINMAYIWDYKNSYPIAEIKNAAKSGIAYTSFESDGTGGWTFTGATTIESTAPPTGNNSYNLTNGSISKMGLTSTLTYIVSYWTINASAYSITGTITGYPLKGKTIGSWTYYEHKITGITSVTLSGSGYLDELRLYPASAQMTTYTYAPLIGMTSQCDAANHIIHYEYDGLSRLKLIRDQDNNIIKQYDYQYQRGTASIWQVTGNTRCKPCSQNSAYITNVRQHEEKDINDRSSTYNTARWIDDGVSSSCATGAWQNVGSPTCQKSNTTNTGYQQQQQKDVNPCSPTYNQYRYQQTGKNLTACPLNCNASNCTGTNNKCVNSVCETAFKKYKSKAYQKVNGTTWMYVYTYVYQWSDCSESASATEQYATDPNYRVYSGCITP